MELAKGRRWRRGPLSVARIASEAPDPAVAFAISRRVGNAVVRNRLRRRLREILGQHDLPGGYVYLFGARPEAATTSFLDLDRFVGRLVDAMRNEP